MFSEPTIKWYFFLHAKHKRGAKAVMTVHHQPPVSLDEANEWFWKLPTGISYACECGNSLWRVFHRCWFCNAGFDKLPPEFGEMACNVFSPFLQRYGDECLTHSVPSYSTPEMRAKVTQIFGPGGVGRHCFIASKWPATDVNVGLYPHVKNFIRHMRKTFSGRHMISNV